MTTAAADIEQTPASTAGLTPPSDERPSSAPEETAAPAQDQATPEEPATPEPEETPSEPAQPEAGTPEYYRSLQERVDTGDVLTSQERESLNRHYQSERDRQQSILLARQFTQQQRQAVVQKTQAFRQQAAQMFLQRLGYGETDSLPDADRMRVELLMRDWDQAFTQHLADTEPLHMARWELHLRDNITRLAGEEAGRVFGELDTEGNPAQRLAQTIDAYANVRAQQLVEQSDLGKQVKKLTEERDRYKLQVTRAVGERGANGSGPDTRGRDNAPPRFQTEGDLHRAYNRNEIDSATYAREHKRITGRDP